MRVSFLKKGAQKKFLEMVLEKINCVSLRSLNERGIDISYSSLKNYYSERRLLPKELFDDLCYLAKIDSKNLEIGFLDENWGRVKGGKKGKKRKS
jgi:hypothetical protein